MHKVKTLITMKAEYTNYATGGRVMKEQRKIRPAESTVERLSAHLNQLAKLIQHWLDKTEKRWESRRGSQYRSLTIEGDSLVVGYINSNSSPALDMYDYASGLNESYDKEEMVLDITVMKNGRYTTISSALLEQSAKFLKKNRNLKINN